MKFLSRVTSLFLAPWLLLAASVAQEPIHLTDNESHDGDFQGKQDQHNWTFTLTEALNHLRLRVESPTAQLIVSLHSASGERLALMPVNRQGLKHFPPGVIGQHIEAVLSCCIQSRTKACGEAGH